MSKKTTTKKKPAAPAGKPARKTAKPMNPIILGGKSGEVFGTGKMGLLLETLPVSRLKEMLRSRALPIPKDKETMVDRLTAWVLRDGGTFVLSLH